MPPSPSSRPCDSEPAAAPQAAAPRSPRSATTLIAVLIAAETAVCTGLQQDGASTTSSIVAPAPVCEATATSHSLPSNVAVSATGAMPGSLDALDDALRSEVCSYLNWKECLKVKGLSKAWNAATQEVVRMETLPDAATPTPALFLTCPKGLAEDAAVEAQLRCQHPAKWRCLMCGFCNSETRILCGNRACQIPCPTHRDCARLFLGQLRREGTVGTVKWLVEGVFGSGEAPVTIVNIENHRQLTTSRGKGCAWVYLQHRSMADAVLMHNHRVFFDVHPETGREGVWIVGAGSEAALQECVKVRGYIRGRDLLLPRNALVVEFPSRQPNQAWGSTSTPPTYNPASAVAAAATAGSSSSAGASAAVTSSTPDANWYPATDSPPSESSVENPVQPSSPSNAGRSVGRRNQPYLTPSWTPTAAVSPSMPSEFPPLPPQMATTTAAAMMTPAMYYDGTEAYFQHPDYDAYAYAAAAGAYHQGGRHSYAPRGWNSGRHSYHYQQSGHHYAAHPHYGGQAMMYHAAAY